MAAGRSVILAIDGVIRQVVEDANAGLAVPPGDPQALAEAVLALARNPEEGRRLGLNGRRTIEEKFSRNELADAFTTLLESIRRKNG